MRIFIACLLLLGSWLPAAAAPATTVQDALKLLPKDQTKNLVRIEAREGDPAPERWYIQVYDPEDENGIREYVVAGKEIVATRAISQFLQNAAAADVVGSKLVKVDSDDLIKLVQRYAEANKATVARISYTMLKETDNPAPVWKLTCLDDAGKKVAEMVVNARNANVVSHEGFEKMPGQASDAKPSASPDGKPIVKPAIPVKPSPSAKPSPQQERTPLFQRMFGGKH